MIDNIQRTQNSFRISPSCYHELGTANVQIPKGPYSFSERELDIDDGNEDWDRGLWETGAGAESRVDNWERGLVGGKPALVPGVSGQQRSGVPECARVFPGQGISGTQPRAKLTELRESVEILGAVPGGDPNPTTCAVHFGRLPFASHPAPVFSPLVSLFGAIEAGFVTIAGVRGQNVSCGQESKNSTEEWLKGRRMELIGEYTRDVKYGERLLFSTCLCLIATYPHTIPLAVYTAQRSPNALWHFLVHRSRKRKGGWHFRNLMNTVGERRAELNRDSRRLCTNEMVNCERKSPGNWGRGSDEVKVFCSGLIGLLVEEKFQLAHDSGGSVYAVRPGLKLWRGGKLSVVDEPPGSAHGLENRGGVIT
ncbi:hypothetical protein BU15DRAFT_65784 [Melanogaster broomeanus]|nr:hypothetical protein BU15DRAFT_65784 [Melanogaster broomeanus]